GGCRRSFRLCRSIGSFAAAWRFGASGISVCGALAGQLMGFLVALLFRQFQRDGFTFFEALLNLRVEIVRDANFNITFLKVFVLLNVNKPFDNSGIRIFFREHSGKWHRSEERRVGKEVIW